MSEESIIEFKNFRFQYFSQAQPTLHNINLIIKRGEKVLIAGPSGSGKSTLGNCLNGLIPFSYKGEISGSLKINNQETRDLNIFQISKKVGTVLQDPDGQFVGLTVNEDIAFVLENDNKPTQEMKNRVAQAARIVDMQDYSNSSPYELSGGQKQRTSLAGVIINNVDILLFDEPLANLDPATGKAAIEVIDDIHKKTGKTIVIIEHRIEDVLHRDIDRVIVMNNGRIVTEMNPDNILSSSILAENGLREPLYITALKYAGIAVSPNLAPGHIDSLKMNHIKKTLCSWHNSLKPVQQQLKSGKILKVENLSFSYNGVIPTIQNINFDLAHGELIALVGKNGAGKSTLSQIICGFEKEDEGSIFYTGENMTNLTIKERAEKIGLVMQNPNQMISKPMIYDEIALGLRLRNIDEEKITHRVEKALKICNLTPFRKWPISALSFGQKKRVTIASILVLEPEILILDEPTAGQDYRHYSDIMNFIIDINKTGVAIILITHDMHLMLEYASRAVVLSEGMIIADASPSEILTNQEIIIQANLKETSLFKLSRKAGIKNGTVFVQNFIDYEKSLKGRINPREG